MKNETKLPIILLIVIIALLAFLLYANWQSSNQLNSRLDAFETQLMHQTGMISMIDIPEYQLAESDMDSKETEDSLPELIKGPSFQDFHMKKIRDAGIDNPSTIAENLIAQINMLDFEGKQGSTVFFTSIHLLTDHYVLAEFEDGHRSGQAMFKYEIADDQSIKWTKLSEVLD